ncbi:hypothetical protein [Nocardia huaxiensis]|uniref:Uncharacterized protein n=1 Tax=Nocardia huaxiensis TaxID=2755382 RepID=A0A7D6VBR3_9NOCA|nr:hypothetical protein [Nocardia huaxiensis]QLY28475.1 hypothetical protein H0264_24280 [Nocardia huaxiensis]UFS98075.1 hypothetical protein LPY97_09325 [Nocardia huaxiensis]
MSDAERVNWDHLKSRQPTDTDRDALRTELVDRALAVRQNGWDAYRSEWLAGDLAAVAYLLDDAEMLAELEEPEGSVLTRYAGNLYGFNGARKDIAAGLVGTQDWFAKARADLAKRTTS